MILIIQNGYSCDYEMRLFASMFFGDDEDVTITQNFIYSDKNINVYTHIIFDGKSYFEDYNNYRVSYTLQYKTPIEYRTQLGIK